MCTLISKLNGTIGGSTNVAKKPIRVWKVVSNTGLSLYQDFKYEMCKRYKTNSAPEFVTVYTEEYNARRNNNHAEYPDIEDIKGIGITSGRFHVYTDEFIKKWLGSIPERHMLLRYEDDIDKMLLCCRIPEGSFYEIGIDESKGVLTTNTIEVADIDGTFNNIREAV